MGSARRTRFAPTVPAERRSRQRAVTEDTSEPQLPQHLQRLVKQAQLEGKVVRPREPVQGLERRQRRGEKAAHSHTETSEQINLSANDDISKGNLGTSQPGRVNAEVLTRTRGEGTSAQAKREVDEPRSLYGLPEFDSEIDGARTLNLDWTDDSQYYPTVLSAADEGATAATTASSVREALADTEQGQYLVIQLPTKLSSPIQGIGVNQTWMNMCSNVTVARLPGFRAWMRVSSESSACTRTVRSSCTWEKQSSTYYQELGSRMTSSWYASTPHVVANALSLGRYRVGLYAYLMLQNS